MTIVTEDQEGEDKNDTMVSSSAFLNNTDKRISDSSEQDGIMKFMQNNQQNK